MRLGNGPAHVTDVRLSLPFKGAGKPARAAHVRPPRVSRRALYWGLNLATLALIVWILGLPDWLR